MSDKHISHCDPRDTVESYNLWVGGNVPASHALRQLGGVKFRFIKKYEPEIDGYKWLKGVAIAHYQEQWVVSFGHNKATIENTATEVSNAIISRDDGNTWGQLHNIDDPPGDLATSHGVHLVDGNDLWAFMGAFHGRGRPGGNVHTRAYLSNPESFCRGNPVWEFKGVVAENGFWPLQEPLRMENGCWIMAGMSVGGGENDNTPPAVALSRGDLTSWEVIKVPTSIHLWGEAAVILNGHNLLLVSRSHSLKAGVSLSSDYGRTWSQLSHSNLPMADSKPYAGTLSTGRHYLINTICGDVGELKHKRNPLSIAITRPGELQFDAVYRILDCRWPVDGASSYTTWAYPYAVEHHGHLWIVFHMGAEGRYGSGAAGLTIIPINELKS